MEQVVMEDIKKEERQQAEVRAATKVTTQSEHTGAGFYCPPCLTLGWSYVQLQAWWRGCMVRRGMGAFKKPEEKKTKKKKGKKKK